MIFSILTLFPEMFSGLTSSSILKRAAGKEQLTVNLINFRDFTTDKYGRVDTPPIGGGAGLILKAQPIVDALKSIKEKSYVVFLTPRGIPYTQNVAQSLASKHHVTLVCGHYEGFDERLYDYADELISIGDYILTGGEIAAMAIVDSVTRLLPGVIDEASTDVESFDHGLLEYPQYTEPKVFEDRTVPAILYSGNHGAIASWRKQQSLYLTYRHRPDLFNALTLTKDETKLFHDIQHGVTSAFEEAAILKGKKFTK
jgi:tRNA (guanine37-N1)-methyltransferase